MASSSAEYCRELTSTRPRGSAELVLVTHRPVLARTRKAWTSSTWYVFSSSSGSCSRSQASLYKAGVVSAGLPVSSSTRRDPYRSTCAPARESIHKIAARSGSPLASTQTKDSRWWVKQTAAIRLLPGTCPSACRTAASVALHQSRASCSFHPGAAEEVTSAVAPAPSTAPAASMTIALEAVVEQSTARTRRSVSLVRGVMGEPSVRCLGH